MTVKSELSTPHLSEKDFEEIFPHPAVREVAFEIRFAPRLRIQKELWKFQDVVANAYPEASEENGLQPDGRIVAFSVFANSATKRVMKISQENFAVIANSYTTFEEFKSEATTQAETFCRLFDISGLRRIGLRYINHIELEGEDKIAALQKYVNVPLTFERLDRNTIRQLLTEFRFESGPYKLTVRGALLQLPVEAKMHLYILDLDCCSESGETPLIGTVLDDLHNEIQKQFLLHVTEQFKEVMRGR